jgi:hypothetical protein
MVIKASSATEIRTLVAALGHDDEVTREAAIARLAIIGGRAVDRLVTAYRATTDRDTHVNILRALEPSADDRALGLAREALGAGGDVAAAATGVLRGLLGSPQAATTSSALDALMTVVMDPSAEHRLRLAAADALRELPGVRAEVAKALATMPGSSPAVIGDSDQEQAATVAAWRDALEGRLPDRPGPIRQGLTAEGPGAPLGALQELVDRVRAREATVESARAREEWCALRGALHQTLALRGSRVALYDLRETVEAARDPLPPSFLAALHAVGDDSCLEAIAAAHHHAHDANDARWKVQLRDAFQAIVRREHLTRRSAGMKRVGAKWPDSFRELTAQ